MVVVLLNGLMAEYMSENFKMTKSMAMESLRGLMVDSMTVHGNKESNMEQVSLEVKQTMGLKLDFGKMVKE